MDATRACAVTALSCFLLLCAPILLGQDRKPANPATELPNLVLVVHQEIQHGKMGTREKLEVATKRTIDHLQIPNIRIDLQALTGGPEVLFFEPFDSLEDLEQSLAEWRQVYASHPDLAQLREEIDALVTSERTIVAVRRDDLGYRADGVDLSETRFMRVLEVRLFAGHENDVVEALKTLAQAHEKINAESPWAVYQVSMGMPSPAFLIFVFMPALRQNDDLSSWREGLLEPGGEEAAQRAQQTAREAYASIEGNLYAVHPQTSHISKEFATGDPDFWTPKMESDAKSPKERSEKPLRQKAGDPRQN